LKAGLLTRRELLFRLIDSSFLTTCSWISDMKTSSEIAVTLQRLATIINTGFRVEICNYPDSYIGKVKQTRRGRLRMRGRKEGKNVNHRNRDQKQ